MRVGSYDISLNGIVNLDKVKQKRAEIGTRIQKQQLARARADVNRWRSAIAQAESAITPSRVELMRIYQEVTLDTHYTAVAQSRKNKVLARGFNITNQDGEIDVKATRLFNKHWFNRFLSMALDARFYGYSLVEFGPIVNDEFTNVNLVPRQNVIPEQQAFTLSTNGTRVPFNTRPISDWVIFVGETSATDLGLLNQVAPLALWKRLITATWAEFNELFGVPLRILRTMKNDPDQRQELERMLQDMGSSSWALIDPDDELEIVSGVKAGGHQTFNDFIDRVNAEISKVILGQTMTTEDGSSRSQAEVHQDTMASYTGADLRWLAFIINGQLIPFMERHGFNLQGLKFVWDLEEELSKKDQFSIDQVLLQHYKINPEYIAAKYGTPVEDKEQDSPEALNSIMPAVRNLYADFLKEDHNHIH